jgi:hypothetical protein
MTTPDNRWHVQISAANAIAFITENSLAAVFTASRFSPQVYLDTYGIFICTRQDRARNFIPQGPFMWMSETDGVITMPGFVAQPVCTPYHFDIRRSRQGCWIARDRGGLAGGTFLTCKEAVRFALFEVGGDSARVHVRPEMRQSRSGSGA